MSRFTRLEKPLMSPGECIVCKSYALPVVDFNVSLQAMNGKLYLCEECLHEALETINPAAFDSDNKNWEAYAKGLEKKNEELTDGIIKLRNSAADLFAASGLMPERPTVEVDAESAGDNKTTNERVSKGKPADKKQRSNDLSGTSVDELLGIK